LVDPFRLEVFKNAFSSVAEQMGAVLRRTAFSPNIKERQDFSCAVFDAEGRLVAQASHIPVHLGSMPASVKEAIKSFSFQEGDAVVLNDPYAGGTHLPDVTVVSPVFYEGELLFFVANRAHHADVGGASPGSMPVSKSLFEEGFVIPPTKLVKRGRLNEEFLRLFLRNVRAPKEREADFKAQLMANEVGARLIAELLNREGKERVLFYAEELINYAERLLRKRIKRLPDGSYCFFDFVEDDGLGGGPYRVALELTVKDDELIFDFTGSDGQAKGGVNAVRSVVESAVLYAVVALLGGDLPVNEGCLRAIKVKTRKGSLLDPRFPAGVSAGNVETSQRIVDVVLGAFAQVLPEEVPAASQGTMNNVAVGGIDPRTGEPFAYYETIGGGTGASAKTDGESAVHSHMTNTLNTPVEALEHHYPIRVLTYRVRRGSGGAGLRRGGDGIVREYLFLADAEVSVVSERRKLAPYGLFGGRDGAKGKNLLIDAEGNERELPSKFVREFKRGERLRIETPGGGGYGAPDRRRG